MITKRIIPCLDCKNGRVVKGVQFQNLIDSGMPSELASLYEQDGADEIVLLDVGASLENRNNQLETVRQVRKVISIPLTVGGGVRTIRNIEDLLRAGADKVSINSAAVLDPRLITQASRMFGAQCIVASIDALKREDSWNILSRSGTTSHAIPVESWTNEVIERGAGEILLTSLDRDGTQEGYDLDLIKLVSKNATVPIIASGGAKTTEHLLEGFRAGADAVLAASIFHFKQKTITEIKQELDKAGIEVRI